MFDFIYQGLGYVIRFCYDTIGFGSYALALLWFALFVKLLLLPFGIKQQKNQIKGAKLRPKLYAIEKKYAGRTDQVTMRKKQQEIMEMQQREGYSPLSGCLPMLIQLPLILILYRIIQRPLSYISMLSEEAVKSLAAAVGVENAANEIEILGKASLVQFKLAESLDCGTDCNKCVSESDAHVAKGRGVRKVTLHARDRKFTRHKSENGIRKTEIAFGILEVNGVHLMWHRRGANLTLHGALLEISHRHVHPHVAIKVEKHRVPTCNSIEKLRDTVMRLTLRGETVLTKP